MVKKDFLKMQLSLIFVDYIDEILFLIVVSELQITVQCQLQSKIESVKIIA